MITPIDVVDSAVKIGLGALISGLATYWLAKANHLKTVEKERAQRRRDMLEVVAQQVANSDQAACKSLGAIIEWLHFAVPGEPMSDEKFAALTRLENDLKDSGKDIRNARATLWLLDEVNCLKFLEEYVKCVKIYFLNDIAARGFEVQALEKDFDALVLKRNAFFSELSNAYRKI